MKAGHILHPQYGTRCSTVLLQGKRTRYAERTFAPDGSEGQTVHFEFGDGALTTA